MIYAAETAPFSLGTGGQPTEGVNYREGRLDLDI